MSKSIIGLLYGIALANGKVTPPNAPLLASFPEYTELAADTVRNRWTIQGADDDDRRDWDELRVPYSDPANSETAMDMAPDRYRFVLSGPVLMEQGKRWIYKGARPHCWPGLLRKAPAHRYTRLRARRCSTLSALARRNGLPIAAAKPLPRPACA